MNAWLHLAVPGRLALIGVVVGTSFSHFPWTAWIEAPALRFGRVPW